MDTLQEILQKSQQLSQDIPNMNEEEKIVALQQMAVYIGELAQYMAPLIQQ